MIKRGEKTPHLLHRSNTRESVMLAYVVGNVDQNAALVLAVLFITICIFITTAIAKRRSRRDVQNEFDLAKIKLANEHNEKLFVLTTDREVKTVNAQHLLVDHVKARDE
jgi:preprotein translocase subunit SecG